MFYDALATSAVALRESFRARFGQAIGLFGFTTAVSIVAAAPAVALAVVVGSPAVRRALGVVPGGLSELSPVALGVGLSLGVGTALIGVAVVRFAFEFVAPAMVARDLGVVAAWRRVWDGFRGSRSELAVYAVVHAVIAGGVGIVQAAAIAFMGGVVAAFALVALVAAAVPLGGVDALIGTPAGVVALTSISVCAFAAFVVLALPLRLVARTYLIAYEASVLAGIDSRLSPLAPKFVVSGGEALTGRSEVADESRPFE